MESGALRLLDPGGGIYRRGRLISAINRWISLAVGLLALAVLWGSPGTNVQGGVALAAGYALFAFAAQAWLRRHPRARAVKVLHIVVDAAAVGVGAYFSGGMQSPMWILLYPHVVAVAVRGGLPYALSIGVLDAAVVAILTRLTPGYALGDLHAVGLLWCAFMGGMMGSYLQSIQSSLYQLNKELVGKNQQLEETNAAHLQARREQEVALHRLSESEERYRRLLERIQDGVVIVQGGRVVYCNQVFAAMTGAPREELLGTDFRELAPPEDRRELAERYRRWEQANLGSPGMLESRLRTRGGELLLVVLRASSVEFEGKRSVIATVRDVTRERQMEQELKGHAERLAAINEIANAVNLSLTIGDIFAVAAAEARRLVPFERLTIVLLDEAGPGLEVVAVGAGAGRRRARIPREAVAWAFKRPASWAAGGDEPLPPYAQELLGESGIQSLATVPLRSKDRVIGAIGLGRVRPQPFSAKDLGIMEPVARHVAIALDNARLLEAMRRRSREFESLVTIGRGILERLDLDAILPLVVRSVNTLMDTHFCMLLLRAGDELVLAAQEGLEAEVIEGIRGLKVGESLTGWVAKEGQSLSVPDMQEDPRLKYSVLVRRFGYRSFLCVPLRRGADVLGTLEVVTKEVRHFGPEQQDLLEAFAGLAAVAIDNARLYERGREHMAEMAEANRRLEELDRLRQQYLRNVSHEFRTPLTVIKGYAEYLMDADGPVHDVMRIINESCDRVIDMVDTLLEVSRIEQGAESVLQVQSLDLREVVAASVDPLRVAAEKRSITLELDLPGEPLPLEGDLGLLLQCVRKLVENALKYSGSGSRVVVRGRREQDGLALEVEDQGIGIPEEHQSRIFEKFYMIDGGIARRASGTGVGLYLVREIVRLHSGTVEVRSRPGEGSLFSVRLPRRLKSRPETALV